MEKIFIYVKFIAGKDFYWNCVQNFEIQRDEK